MDGWSFITSRGEPDGGGQGGRGLRRKSLSQSINRGELNQSSSWKMGYVCIAELDMMENRQSNMHFMYRFMKVMMEDLLILHIASIIHLSHIHQLSTPCSGDIFWYSLAEESLDSGFDGVHVIAGSRHPRGHILYTCAFADFVNE